MSGAITEHKDPFDAFNPPESSGVIVHDDETALAYRQAAQEAARRGPTRVIQSKQPAVPAGPHLPMSGVANAVVGRELARLRDQAAGLARAIQSPPVGPGGYQVDHLVAQQRQMRAELDVLREEIARIGEMDDHQVRAFAYKLGAR